MYAELQDESSITMDKCDDFLFLIPFFLKKISILFKHENS